MPIRRFIVAINLISLFLYTQILSIFLPYKIGTTLFSSVAYAAEYDNFSSAESQSLFADVFSGSFVGTFFGYPFVSIGIVDLTAATVLCFIILRVIRSLSVSKKNHAPHTSNGQDASKRRHDLKHPYSDEENEKAEIKQRAASAWASLRSVQETTQQISYDTPRDFDANEFLAGAKILFSRLQKSWSARDISTLEPFITEEMLALLHDQAKKNPKPTKTEVVLLDAKLLKVTRIGEEERTQVLFDALLQTGDDPSLPSDVKEIWHFTHNYVENSSWQLDAIEAVNNDN